MSLSDTDIQEVVPYDMLRKDGLFYQYIYNSNVQYVCCLCSYVLYS